MVIIRLALAVCCGDDESVTCTENGNCPCVVGVPEITPAELKESPGGKVVPLISIQEYGGVPLEACKVVSG